MNFLRKVTSYVAFMVLIVVGLMLAGLVPVPFKCKVTSADKGTCTAFMGEGELKWEYVSLL